MRNMAKDTVSLARILPLMLFPTHSCPALPLLSRRGSSPCLCRPLTRPTGPPHRRRGFRAPPSPTWLPIEDRVNMNSFRRVAARAAPTVEVDRSGPQGSPLVPLHIRGRAVGLRPSHIRSLMRPASADLLLSLSEVVYLLLQGELPSWSARTYAVHS